MTREEAIQTLTTIDSGYSPNFVANGHIAMGMAIKALEQEPCEDAISRSAAIDLIADFELSMGQVVRGIYALPPVNPQEQKTGYWILTIEDWNKWTCSECGFSERTDIHVTLGYNYCPKCGAKMESEKQP